MNSDVIEILQCLYAREAFNGEANQGIGTREDRRVRAFNASWEYREKQTEEQTTEGH
jgi:hypothetical protein